MVFEHLFPDSLLEKKHWSAFVLAIIYSTISIVIARLLFPANSGLVSVVFLSIFLLPYFETILKREEVQESVEKHHSFWRLFKDNADAIKIYYFLFMGIYLTYVLYSFLAPSFGIDVGSVFREQLSLEGVRGGATFNATLWTFSEILFNNWWVLFACFLIALIAGDGAIFFIAWNASTWGTIFGYRAIAASAHTGQSALWALLVILVMTLPHLLLEAGAYILAAIAGGVISDEVNRPSEVRKFVLYILAVGVFFVGIYYFLTYLFSSWIVELLMMVLVFGLLYMMRFVLEDRNDVVVFSYNVRLFLFAIGVFVLGALIETIVLFNATPLRQVYFAAR